MLEAPRTKSKDKLGEKALTKARSLSPMSAFTRRLLNSTRDISHVQIKKIYFAKCPIRGWFVNHWALIFERIDKKYITV
jgi:hypothetical protein